MSEEESFKDDYRKPMHDGRISFYKILEKMQFAAESSAITGDLESWFRSLRQIYSKTQRYCPDDEKKVITEKIKRANDLIIAQRRLRNSRLLRYNGISSVYERNEIELVNLLYEINDRINIMTKDMMLPLGSDDSEVFDVDDILRREGL